MNLENITPKSYILALIIRDDGERFLLGDGAYEFKQNQLHFNPNTYANDVVELQGSDGQMLAGQVRRTQTQTFDGYIGDASVSKEKIEQYRRAFFMFFRKKHYYTVAYIFANGSSIQRCRGYITDAPSVQELWQKFPEYHIGLNFEDPNYYEYAEDENGNEIYAHIMSINLSSNIGALWSLLTGGNVLFGLAIPAMVFSTAGGYLGSWLAIRRGATFIRKIMLVVLALLILKLAFDWLG